MHAERTTETTGTGEVTTDGTTTGTEDTTDNIGGTTTTNGTPTQGTNATGTEEMVRTVHTGAATTAEAGTGHDPPNRGEEDPLCVVARTTEHLDTPCTPTVGIGTTGSDGCARTTRTE